MATVKNAITLQDKFTPVLGSIIKSMKSTMKVMESLDKAANKGATGKAFKSAQKDITAAENALKKFNNEMDELGSLTDKAKGGFSGMGGAAVVANQAIELIGKGVNAVKGFADMADSYNGIAARLNNIVKPGENVVQVQENIFQAAQRAGADMSTFADTVGKFGNMAGHAFKNTDEIIRFTELINKAISTAGTEGAGADAAIFQLTQGLASGALRGEELNSILEQGTPIAQAIAKSFGDDTVAGLRKYAEQGLLTADVVKNAIFGSEKYINEKFNGMPQTFKKAMTRAANSGMKALAPVFDKFSKLVNSKGFNKFMADIGRGIAWVVGLVVNIIRAIQNVVGFVQRNKPIIIGVLTAIAIVVGVSLVRAYGSAAIAAIKAGGASVGAAIKAAVAWVAANWPLLVVAASIGVLIALWGRLGEVGRAVGILIVIILGIVAMAVMGVSWPLIAIIAVIAIVAAGFVFFGDIAAEVCGYIGGVLGGLAAYFQNIFVSWYNIVAAFVNFFGNVFNDPIYSIKKLFVDLANSVIGIVKKIAEAIDWVLGTNLAGGLSNVQNNMLEWLGTSDKYKEIMTPKDYKSIVDSVGAGYDTGKKIGKGIADGAAGLADKAKGLLGGVGVDGGAGNAAAIAAAGGAQGPSGTESDPVNTKVKGDVSITEEDIKMLRDIARIDYVNKFTTLQPKMQVTFGDVRETADTKKIMTVLEDMWEEARASALA